MDSQQSFFRLLSWIISAIFLGGCAVLIWATIVGNVGLYKILWPVLLIGAGVFSTLGGLFINSPLTSTFLGPTTVLENKGVRSRRIWFIVLGVVFIVSGIVALFHP
jgi:uncharacterized membrane protein YGL010W